MHQTLKNKEPYLIWKLYIYNFKDYILGGIANFNKFNIAKNAISISFLLFFTCILLYQYKQSQSFHLPSNITNKIWLHSYPSFSFSWSRTWAKMIREIKMTRNYIPLKNEVLVVWFLNWNLSHQIIYNTILKKFDFLWQKSHTICWFCNSNLFYYDNNR